MAAPALITLLRPWQWYKNLVVFVALFFSRSYFEATLWSAAVVTFASFCLLSSATYAWNDALDAQRDRQHPKKRSRPVASGSVAPGTAIALGTLLAAAGVALLWATNAATLLLGSTFLLFQFAYNLFLKHQVIWDVLLIGAGFVIRALAGTTAIEVVPTVWLILCTFLLALFLAFGKRRHELVSLNQSTDEHGRSHRPVLGHYSVELIDQMTNVIATLLLASYVLYTALGTTAWMMFTIPFAIYGVFRYLYLIKRRNQGEEPELIFGDRPTMANAFAWGLIVLLVLLEVPQRLFDRLQAL